MSLQRSILEEVANPKTRRKDLVDYYVLALYTTEQMDWSKINRAIMARWSLSGLEWIKTRAWKKVA